MPLIAASRSGSGSSSPTCGFAPEQGHRVRVDGVVEHIAHRSRLDDLAGVHDRDAVADVGHDAEVVRHDHHRHPGVGDQRTQQAEDLGLHRDVERRRRLIRDQQLRLPGERKGDRHALRHAARQLVRVALQHPFGVDDTDLPQQLDGGAASLGAADAAKASDRTGQL